MKPASLSVDLLRIDAGTQSRLAINEDVVAEYTEVITQAGIDWPFPPLDVFHDGADYFVADGFHRLLAAIRAKLASVPCNIHKGTASDARIFGMTANDRHGLRMSREDKRACVEWLLDNGGKMTQKAVAEKAGVDVRTVQRIIADRNPSSIAGKANPPKVEPTLSPHHTSRGDSDPFADPFDEDDPFGEAPESPENAPEPEEPDQPPTGGSGARRASGGAGGGNGKVSSKDQLAKQNKTLAKSLIDKAARAVCDLHEVKPNRVQRDKVVKLLQQAGGMIW